MLKKSKFATITISTVIIIVLLVSVALVWYRGIPGVYENFAQASRRCGHDPVIGSENIYYQPTTGSEEKSFNLYQYVSGSEGSSGSYRLMSLYDPANVDMSEYPKPKFFCSTKAAIDAGYKAHGCCGVIPIRRP